MAKKKKTKLYLKSNSSRKLIRMNFRKWIKNRIDEIRRDLKIVYSMPIPDLMTPTSSAIHNFTYGFDPMVIRENYQRMINAGWTCSTTPKEFIADVRKSVSYGDQMYFYHENSSRMFSLWYLVGSEGSNCKRVKIGSKTVERDIFEIVCNEGIAEMEGVA